MPDRSGCERTRTIASSSSKAKAGLPIQPPLPVDSVGCGSLRWFMSFIFHKQRGSKRSVGGSKRSCRRFGAESSERSLFVVFVVPVV